MPEGKEIIWKEQVCEQKTDKKLEGDKNAKSAKPSFSFRIETQSSNAFSTEKEGRH